MDSLELKKSKSGESLAKRQTRSVHEKQRRQEMNTVLHEMMSLLPGVFMQKMANDSESKIPKKPDKCFIIGGAVDFIKNADKGTSTIDSSLLSECLRISRSLILKISNFIILEADGDCETVFGTRIENVLNKDLRSLLDFNCARTLSLPTLPTMFTLKTWKGKLIQCSVKVGQNPSEHILACVPSDDAQNDFEFPHPKTTSKLAAERPILAAMLMSKDEYDPSHNICSTPTPSLHCDSASTSSSFLSPQSSSSTCQSNKKQRKTSVKKTPSGRKRLRSVNVIVESYSLDDKSKHVKIERRNDNDPVVTTNPFPSPHSQPSLVPTSTPQINPYDMLSPGYRDIWLRLQSERLLLEERVLAKERELQNLMLTTVPQLPTIPDPFTSTPSIVPSLAICTTRQN